MSGPLRRLRMMLELVRFSHTIFALPFAILATVMAFKVPLPDGQLPQFRWWDLLGILLCMVCARTSAMAFNRWIDHRFDAANPRTANRHLPAGLMSRSEVLGLVLITSIGFVASTLVFLPNRLPVVFSIPVLLFLLGYSLAKRFTAAAHLWLGIALSLSPICAWVALRGFGLQQALPGEFAMDLLPPIVLAVAIALWVTGFDIIYACQDAAFDAAAGLHSVPAKFGIAGGLKIAAVLHAAMVLALLMLPWTSSELGLGKIYYSAITGIAGLLWYEHRLVKPQDLQRVGVAFFNVNAIVSVVLLIAATVDCWL
jgi:4-hydroxybenzoate polyprenyltransferase